MKILEILIPLILIVILLSCMMNNDGFSVGGPSHGCGSHSGSGTGFQVGGQNASSVFRSRTRISISFRIWHRIFK